MLEEEGQSIDKGLIRHSVLEFDYAKDSSETAHAEQNSSHPHWKWRWAILVLGSFILFGNYYSYDNPAALNTLLREYMGTSYERHQYQLNLLYSVYSMPNIILPFFGGYLVDTLGVRRFLIILSTVLTVGQAFFAIGTTAKSFSLMLLGRMLFGLGGETLSVAQVRVTTKWFRGKELAFALGTNLSVARLGSVANANLSPLIAIDSSLPAALWLGFVWCLLSLLCATAVALIDILCFPREIGDLYSSKTSTTSADMTQCVFIKAFPVEFWLLCFICVSIYGVIVPFNNIASDFLQAKWYQDDPAAAGRAMSIPDITSAIITPLWGYLTDRYGKRAWLLLVAGVWFSLIHAMFAVMPTYDDNSSAVPWMILMGIGSSLYAATIWPCVAYAVPDAQFATAYGIMVSFLNGSLVIFPLIVAAILSASSFAETELFFAAVAGAGAVLAVALNYFDMRSGAKLNTAVL